VPDPMTPEGREEQMGPVMHTHDGEPPYIHSHAEPDCTHRWKTCPVHGKPDGQMPAFRVAMTCIYGGAELRDGGTWDQDTSNEVTEKIADRLGK
jgi:hypothetical protein